MLQKFYQLYRSCIIEHPKTSLLMVAVVVLIAAMGLPNFKLDASSDSLTLEHDSDLDYFREINQRYSSGDFLIVTFRPNQELFSDSSIALLKELKDKLSQVPGVVSTLSMLDAPLLYSPKISLSQMSTPRTLLTPGVDRNAAREEFLESPIYREMLLGPDQQTTAILLNLRVDSHYIKLVRHRDALRLKRTNEGLTESEKIELELVAKQFLDYRTQVEAEGHQRVKLVREIVAEYKDQAQIFVGGATMITADMIDFIKSDLKVFGLGVLIFMIAIMAFIFRQPRFVILPILTCLSSVVIMLGFLSWIDWRLTVISSNFVSLLLIISLAITIHLLVRYRELHGKQADLSQAELVWQTVSFMALPCLYTTLTTMVAFVSLVVSDIRPVIDFGWMMTMGLALSLVLSFVIIPAGLMLLPKGESREKADKSALFTILFSRFTEHHPTTVLTVSLLLLAISSYGISTLEVENRFIDYFHDSTEIYQGMSVIDKNLGGTITLDIILDEPSAKTISSDGEGSFAQADMGDEFYDPAEADEFSVDESGFGGEEFFGDSDPFSGDVFSDSHSGSGNASSYWFTVAGIESIKGLHDYLDSLPEIGKVQSLANSYEMAEDINGGALNDFELALMRKSLPPEITGVLIDPYLSDKDNQTRITLRAKETSKDLHRAQLLSKVHEYATQELGFAPEQVHLTGLLVLYNNMLQSLFTSQIVTLAAVFLGIFIMFVVLFRSPLLALIALLPNLLAAMCVLGGMGLAGIPLDMMTITIAAITVGIGVDDTIHYIHRFKQEFSIDGDYVASMHRSHATIGRAMFYTSVIIIVGFSILTLSKFIPTIYFGLLTGLAMLAAILAALTLLPRLILLIKPLPAAA